MISIYTADVLRWVNVMAGRRLNNVLCSEPVLDSIILQINDVRSDLCDSRIELSLSAVPPSCVCRVSLRLPGFSTLMQMQCFPSAEHGMPSSHAFSQARR